MKKLMLISTVLVLVLAATSAIAQTSSFTYQGRFTDGGTAANGTYDMQFKLFDGSGNQVGSTITNGAVTVASGVFAVQLDFGAAAFPGADRFLEIGVRAAGNGEAYTALSPRQQLTSAVYAIRAGSTTSADTANSAATATNATQLGGVAANQYVLTNDSRLLDARTPTAGSANYIQNTNSQQTANFNITGNGTTGGTLSGDSVNAVKQFNLNGTRLVGASSPNNTFLGIGAGDSADSSAQNNTFVGRVAGAENTSGNGNTFVGSFAGANNITGFSNSFLGEFTGQNNQTGTNNSFFGSFAGRLNKSASDNSYFGSDAGNKSTGAANSLFGSNAGSSNQTGFANSFFGKDAGLINDNGFANTFVGRAAGSANVSGNSNTIIGAAADVAADDLSFATAIGAGAQVGTSNTITLGRNNGNDGVRVPGTLTLITLGSAGSTSLCRNASNQIATCSSSRRYKKDLHPFTRGLALLNQLKPITFKWKADDSSDLGFGAEDVAAVEPLLVTRNNKGEVEGVKYDRISAVLVNAVQEQQQQISQQQEQIKRQRDEIESLKKLVCRRHRRAPVCK